MTNCHLLVLPVGQQFSLQTLVLNVVDCLKIEDRADSLNEEKDEELRSL
jgi:hypothetical protein